MTAPTICVCGGGIMARGIVSNLQRNGFFLRLYNRSPARIEHFANARTIIADTPAEAAADADFVIASVSDDIAAEQIWLGKQGVLVNARAGSIVIEMSTVSVGWIDTWVRAAVAAGLKAIDCPVTGSRTGAQEGTLFAFVGADSGTLEEAEPILSACCTGWHHFGSPGMGMRFKLVYNLIGAGIGAIFAEGLALGEHMGLRAAETVEVIKRVGWGSAVARSKGDAMATRNHGDVHYTMELFHKDVRYALASAADATSPFDLAKVVERIYRRGTFSHRESDISAVREAVSFSDGTPPNNSSFP